MARIPMRVPICQLLLGRVYTTDCIDDSSTSPREDYDGFLRVAVTGGGDGGGTVDVEIIGSQHLATTIT